MPKSSSPSPTITAMNPVKTLPQTLPLTPAISLATHAAAGGGLGASVDDDSEDVFPSDLLHQQSLLMDDDGGVEDDDDTEFEPQGLYPQNPNLIITAQSLDDAHPRSPLSSLLFRDPDEDDEEEEEDEPLAPATGYQEPELEHKPDMKPSNTEFSGTAASAMPHVDPSPHISSQFYTFNRDSHALMIRCLLEGRLATPEEIRQATPQSVLKSWRSVWKDRNEDTAYLTAWKRIQDKLHAHVDGNGSTSLYFKNNPLQCVSHVEQWQEIVSTCHADPDLLRHLGLKETVERIKQSWTVGAKFYGIPESFIRLCISSCAVCFSSTSTSGLSSCGSGGTSRPKRRRFEYTESLDVPARDVPLQLQQLATKHKVVLCIRQKYIRYKPFMAEVKDYACHRAGEPSSATGSSSTKKTKIFKREPYQSKRCGCGFRIRAIVPITNYNEKDKTFVYQEEGTAVFKLYAVHSGHEPGPLDGNARIIHRVVGQKDSFEFDPVVYGVREESEPESFVGLMVKDDFSDAHHSVLQQVQELRVEASLLERRMSKMPLEMPPEMIYSLSHELSDILNRLRIFTGQEESLGMGDGGVGQWRNQQNDEIDEHVSIFDSKDAEIIEVDGTDFDSNLGAIIPWDRISVDCQDRRMLLRGCCKSDKWLLKEDCSDFDEKSMINSGEDEDSKLINPVKHDVATVVDANLVGMQVDGFYPDNGKWYDSPSDLVTGADSGNVGFRHGGFV